MGAESEQCVGREEETGHPQSAYMPGFEGSFHGLPEQWSNPRGCHANWETEAQKR